MIFRQYSRAGGTGLIIEQTSDGFYLYSFPKVGIEGDTWHRTAEEAREQAKFQFHAVDWTDVPHDIVDIRAFGRQISN